MAILRTKLWVACVHAALLMLGPAAYAHAAESHITPEMDGHILRGLDEIYRMDFDKAEAEGRRLVALQPEHPIGYFSLAAVAWVRYFYETEQTDRRLKVVFEKRMRTAMDSIRMAFLVTGCSASGARVDAFSSARLESPGIGGRGIMLRRRPVACARGASQMRGTPS